MSSMDYKALFDKIGLNSIKLTVGKSADPCGPGSRIGGRPLVPKGFEWPRYSGSDVLGRPVEAPLSLLAQIKLDEVAPYDLDCKLPKHGYLLFFYELSSMQWGYDPKDAGCARVYFFDASPDELYPAEYPQDLHSEYRIEARSIAFESKKSIPDLEEFDELFYDSDLECDFEDYIETADELGLYDDADEKPHKLLGYADIIQSSMLYECEAVTRGIYCGGPEGYQTAEAGDIRAHQSDWTLLAQFGTIDGRIMFGDCGCVYYYIRKQDLEKRDFSRVWLLLQCY